jgi:hypothetical protein
MTIYRLGEEMIDVDGTLAVLYKEQYWVDVYGKSLPRNLLRELFIFLAYEQKAEKDKFEKYVDGIIKELL